VQPRSGGLQQLGSTAPVEVRVVFPQLGGDGLTVTVLDVPRSAAMGLAVLDLGEHVLGVRPVQLWPSQRMPREVAVFGYPLREAEPNGVWRDFTVSGATTSRLRQLEWDKDAGSFPGHSGGPVVDAATGALAGILIEGAEEGRFDRFLPVTLVESVWPGLRRPWLYAGKDATVMCGAAAPDSAAASEAVTYSRADWWRCRRSRAGWHRRPVRAGLW
jgi:hypothetical protein